MHCAAMPSDENAAFLSLDPDAILDAVEDAGYACDGHIFALNSYENRVYQVGIVDVEPIIAKFYRPGRWLDAAIIEEHEFTLALAEYDIPVVPPLVDPEGRSLHHYGPFRFALYPRRGGRAPELDDAEHLKLLGRFLARMHALGAVRPFAQRPTLDVAHFGIDSYQYLLAHGVIPLDLEEAYQSLGVELIKRIQDCFARAGDVAYIRLHGDCHPGNILWTDVGPHIVDFDDARMAPAVQDLWMFLGGDREHMAARLDTLLTAYTVFCDFDTRQLQLIEALRTLRMMHHAAWIARRWTDPTFPRAFPWFGSPRYWGEHILHLREQAAAMDEPPLQWC